MINCSFQRNCAEIENNSIRVFVSFWHCFPNLRFNSSASIKIILLGKVARLEVEEAGAYRQYVDIFVDLE